MVQRSGRRHKTCPPRWRSLLFTPGDRHSRLRAAHERGADAATIDLEDAVTATAKGDAQAMTGEFLRLVPTDRTYMVRINGPETPWLNEDLDALASVLDRLTAVVLIDETVRRSDGLSLFLVDLRVTGGITARSIQTMVNHETNEVFFDDATIPASAVVGQVGEGFRYLLDGLNAERILVAAECIGDGRWFVRRSTDYAKQRVVFGRPIGQNQGVQFPLAQAHGAVEAADLMRWRAADLFDDGRPCGAEANMAKLLAADASRQAANVALQTHGGLGLAKEYDIERKFRGSRMFQIAPIATNWILSYIGQHVLRLPRSF